MSELTLYVRHSSKLYRLQLMNSELIGIERQASDGVPSGINRLYPLGSTFIFDGIAWDIDAINELLNRYEAESIDAMKHKPWT